MKKEALHMIIIYEDGTEFLTKAVNAFKEIAEISLNKKSVLDTNEAKHGKIIEVKMYDDEGWLIEKKRFNL